jgi:hypothetical protein
MKIRPVGAELFHADGRTYLRTDRQTDMTKRIVACRKFANAPDTPHFAVKKSAESVMKIPFHAKNLLCCKTVRKTTLWAECDPHRGVDKQHRFILYFSILGHIAGGGSSCDGNFIHNTRRHGCGAYWPVPVAARSKAVVTLPPYLADILH